MRIRDFLLTDNYRRLCLANAAIAQVRIEVVMLRHVCAWICPLKKYDPASRPVSGLRRG